MPNWQRRILPGMIEARSVNVKNTHNTQSLNPHDMFDLEEEV